MFHNNEAEDIHYIRELNVTIGDIITNCQTRKPKFYPETHVVDTKEDRTIGLAFPSDYNISFIIRRLEEECGYVVKKVYSTLQFNFTEKGDPFKVLTVIVVRKIEEQDLIDQ